MGNANSGRRVKPLVGKPRPSRVLLPGGRVVFIGVSDAAQWLGCSASALSAVCRGVPGRGILRRAEARGKVLPPELVEVLTLQSE